jgi:DNA-binding transcriptional regulator GbsR (MarR family)
MIIGKNINILNNNRRDNMFSKIIAFIKKLFTGPSKEEKTQKIQMTHLVKELLRFLEDDKLSDKEKKHILQEANDILSTNKQESDLRELVSQILESVKDNKITKQELLQLKGKAYTLLFVKVLEDD